MRPSPLPSDYPSPFEPGELADLALQAHRHVLFQRWAAVRSAWSALVIFGSLGVAAGIALWPYSLAVVMITTILLVGTVPRLLAARATWRDYPFRYDKMSFFSDERRTPAGAVALLVGGVVVGAAVTGLGTRRWWTALLGGLVLGVLLLPGVVPFLPSQRQRGRIADRALAEHPEQIQAIATLARYPQAPWQLPAWLAGWRTGTPIPAFRPPAGNTTAPQVRQTGSPYSGARNQDEAFSNRTVHR